MLSINPCHREEDDDPVCPFCGSAMEWEDCWNCDDGYTDHDCGEDCCCCADPEPNVRCDVCGGHGGYLQCVNLESEQHQKAVEAKRATAQ